MTLPHTYKGFTIHARKAVRSGFWWLEIYLNGSKLRSYRPPTQAIYLGGTGKLAYDHDIKHCEGLIDRMATKLSY